MIRLGHLDRNEMLLNLLVGIINKYLREYFEDIDTSQTEGNVMWGDIKLKNLKLRPNIFENLGFPFHVVAGKCGKLEISYSIVKLYTEPIKLKLKDLHVLACPSKTAHYDAAAEKAAFNLEKQRQLEEYETMSNHMVEVQNQAPQQATSYDIWVNSILRNIIVEIESVHIRFEDEITKKSEPFSVGVTIQTLDVQSTDSSWKRQYVKNYMPETVYKLLRITGLSVYWNPAPGPPMFHKISEKEVVFRRLSLIPKEDADQQQQANTAAAFKLLFGPLSIEVKISLTLCPDTMQIPFSKAKLRIETTLNELTFTVSDKQIKDILPYIDTLDIFMKTLKFMKYRPEIDSYRGHYKEWWKFAYKCVLEDIQRRRNNFRWNHIKSHTDKCLKYLKTYYKKKVKHNSKPDLDQILNELEDELDLLNIILLRKRVELIEKRQEKDKQQHPTSEASGYISSVVTWVWSWFPSYSHSAHDEPPPASPQPPQEERKNSKKNSISSESSSSSSSSPPSSGNIYSTLLLTQQDKESLRRALAFAKNVYFVNYPPDYADVETSVLLNLFRVQLHKVVGQGRINQRITVLDILLENVSFGFSTRPVNDGVLVELKMGRIDAYGGEHPPPSQQLTRLSTSSEDFYTSPQILTTASSGMQEYLIKLSYEKSPIYSEVDHRLSLEALGLQFIYNAEAIQRLVECFKIPKEAIKFKGPIPTAKVVRNILNFKNSATNKLLRIMEDKGKIEVNICLITPFLVIPQDTPMGRRSSFFVVQLGEINLVGTIMGGTICEHGGCSTFI